MPARLTWRQVGRSDEYRQDGDTHFVDVKGVAFYYNKKLDVVRRYSGEGDYSYSEFGVRGRPEAGKLTTKFGNAKARGRLQNVQHNDRRD